MKKSNIIIFLFFIFSLLLSGVMYFYPYQILFKYYEVKNGRSLSDDLFISNQFALIEIKEQDILLVRNLGHQDEHILLMENEKWNLDYEEASTKNYVVKVSLKNNNCIVFKKIIDSKILPDYSYQYPKLNKVMLVYTALEHNVKDMQIFCNGLLTKTTSVVSS